MSIIFYLIIGIYMAAKFRPGPLENPPPCPNPVIYPEDMTTPIEFCISGTYEVGVSGAEALTVRCAGVCGCGCGCPVGVQCMCPVAMCMCPACECVLMCAFGHWVGVECVGGVGGCPQANVESSMLGLWGGW